MPTRVPLTVQQRWLWQLLLRHTDWNCVMAYGYRLSGELHIEHMARSFAEVVRRHGSLRAQTVIDPDGTAVQEIVPSLDYPLFVEPIAGTTDSEIEARARDLFLAMADRKLTPGVEPLMRIQLLSLSRTEHWLLLTLHRVVADCFSVDQIFEELWPIYAAYSKGEPSPFTEDPPQYADYALRQHRMMGEWPRKHQAYWEQRLDGATPIEWPDDPGVSRADGNRLESIKRLFGEALSEELREFARRGRTLAATVMLAIYVAVLWRWCGKTDITLPFNVAGRQSEHRSVVGYFPYILYLRIQLTGSETFRSLLSQVTAEFFRALSHPDFGMMAIRRPELLAGTFSQWITWHTEETAERVVPICSAPAELTAQRLLERDFGEGLTAIPPGMVDVEVSFFDTAKGIFASGVYRANRFTPSTMERFMEELHSAVEFFVRNPDALLAAQEAAAVPPPLCPIPTSRDAIVGTP